MDVDADPRVAIAVGKTLERESVPSQNVINVGRLEMRPTRMDLSFLRNWFKVSLYACIHSTSRVSYPTLENPVPLSQIMGARFDMVVSQNVHDDERVS